MKNILTLIIFLMAGLTEAMPLMPHINTSPGHLCTEDDVDFDRYRYAEQIHYCKRRVSRELKDYIYQIYNIPAAEQSAYIIDHIIPLSIGGSNQLENLWPEHVSIKRARGQLEYELHLALSHQEMLQEEAVSIILDSKFSNIFDQ